MAEQTVVVSASGSGSWTLNVSVMLAPLTLVMIRPETCQSFPSNWAAADAVAAMVARRAKRIDLIMFAVDVREIKEG